MRVKKNYKKEPITIYPFMFEEKLDYSVIIIWAVIYKYTKEKLGYKRPQRFLCELTGMTYKTVWSGFNALIAKGLIEKKNPRIKDGLTFYTTKMRKKYN